MMCSQQFVLLNRCAGAQVLHKLQFVLPLSLIPDAIPIQYTGSDKCMLDLIILSLTQWTSLELLLPQNGSNWEKNLCSV